MEDFSRLFNIRNFLSGLWILDLYFCLTPQGLDHVLMIVKKYMHINRQRAQQGMTSSSKRHDDESQTKLVMTFVWKLIEVGAAIGILPAVIIFGIEVDTYLNSFMASFIMLASGLSIICVKTLSKCFVLAEEYNVNYNAVAHIAKVFHNNLRDARYRIGVKLTDRERPVDAANSVKHGGVKPT